MKKTAILTAFLILNASLLSSCNEEKYYVPLGNFSKDLTNKISLRINMNAKDYFASEKMQSGELFKIIDSNASYYSEGKQHPFFTVAEKAQLFLLNMGLQDFLPSMHIDVEKNLLEYDEDLIDKQLEVLQYHLYHTVSEIIEINSKAKIIIMSQYNAYTFEKPEQLLFNTIINKINNGLLELQEFKQVSYLSLTQINELIYENSAQNVDDFIADNIKRYMYE